MCFSFTHVVYDDSLFPAFLNFFYCLKIDIDTCTYFNHHPSVVIFKRKLNSDYNTICVYIMI